VAPAACVVAPAPKPAPPRIEAQEPPYRHDQGVAEAAPPPYRHDQGVAEAAPPPYRERPRPPSAPSFEIRTVPAVPLRFRAGPVVQPFAYVAGSDEPLVVGNGQRPVPILARLRVSSAGPGATRVVVESDEPLTVRCGGTSSATPAHVVLRDDAAGARAFVLEDARSRARVEVHVARLR
jgi:hypothetical protein